VGVRLVELETQRQRRGTAGRRLAAGLASRRGARSRGVVAAQRLLAAPGQRVRVALAGFTNHLVQPAGDLARRARQDRELALLGRHQRDHGVPLLCARGLGNGAAQRVSDGDRGRWLHGLEAAPAPAGSAGMIHDELLQHVPGCENGDAPYSQELMGGGKVNRSFLVRTRRGRFVVRLNESSEADPGLDRNRELQLHTVAAGAGIAPHVIYACPDRSCLITDYLEGRPWTPHYFTRMRDLRALGMRLRSLHALPAPSIARFDAVAALRRYADQIVRAEPQEATRIGDLLARGETALRRSGSAAREPAIVHMDLHHGNVVTADRIYFIDWEYSQLGDPLLDLACVMAYYPR